MATLHYQTFTNPSYSVSILVPLHNRSYLLLEILFKSTNEHVHLLPHSKNIQFVTQPLYYFDLSFLEPFLVTTTLHHLLRSGIRDAFSAIGLMAEPQAGESVELVLILGYIELVLILGHMELVLILGYILLAGYFVEVADCVIERLFGYFEFERYLN
jgi:hypothetical protein